MTAKLQIINAAMAHLGEPGFTSLDTDPLPPKAAKALALLDGAAGVSDWVMRLFPWLCTLEYATLDRSDRPGSWKFPYLFELPNDALRVWQAEDAAGCAVHYEAGVLNVGEAAKHVIRSTCAGPLNVGFGERKVLDFLTADVLNVMAYELAARCAGAIQEKDSKGFKLHATAMELMGLAQGGEAGEHGGADPVFAGGFAALRLQAG